ncbi:MAG: D-alanyl-D-alanine carboxypeptidase family protein [Saprospiraceae bacterium]|nr:D-alanyl-D-alanine carboxypeptidase family protein [Saprospiraceae bacterium]
MNKESYFKILENVFLTYGDLKKVSVVESGEKMISLREQNIHFSLPDGLISPSTGNDIFVRESVVEKLREAQSNLDKIMNGYVIDVVYGYRSLQIQKESYQKIKNDLKVTSSDFNDENLLNEAVHRFVAVPEVAGHPTGGAVDVRILDKDENELDMGTKAHEFSSESYTFNPFLTKDVWLNRQKLRQSMLSAGFAPFDGEWWHFSYGDKEWAAYYQEPFAKYEQIEFTTKKTDL